MAIMCTLYNIFKIPFIQETKSNQVWEKHQQELVPVDPTFLQEVYTNYTKYSSKISQSTTMPYNNMIVRNNFDKDIYYIGVEFRNNKQTLLCPLFLQKWLLDMSGIIIR